jgi:hypothetical protein
MASQPLATMLLDSASWDLVVDSNGNMALASQPYGLAQDAASAIKTFLGEVYWDTTIGIPWLQQILGQTPTLSILKQKLIDAALTVQGIASAVVYISSFTNRIVSGQVQIVSVTGQVSASNFSVIAPQGV